MNRTIKLILTVSLLMNVMLTGLGIGYVYKTWRYRMPENAARAQMSAAARDRVEGAFDDMRRDMQATFVDMRAARKDMMDIMAAEPFDAAAYDAAWRKLSNLQAKMGKMRAETVRGLASELKPEDRRLLTRYVSGSFGKRRCGGAKGMHGISERPGNSQPPPKDQEQAE